MIVRDKLMSRVMDITLTPSPWTTLMDYPNGLPKWTTKNGLPLKILFSDYILTSYNPSPSAAILNNYSE